MSAIALQEWDSFVSRVFRRDLDSNAWYVEFFDPFANDNDIFGDDQTSRTIDLFGEADDEENLGLQAGEDSLAIFWQSLKRRNRG